MRMILVKNYFSLPLGRVQGMRQRARASLRPHAALPVKVATRWASAQLVRGARAGEPAEMRVWRMLAVLTGMTFVGGLGCKKGEQATAEGASSASVLPTKPAAVVTAVAPVEEDLRVTIQKATTLDQALKVAKPLMTDTHNEESPGAIVLGAWGIKHMVWSDVGVTKNETTTALIHKDSDEARGKRMCVGGSIIEIHIDKSDFGKVGLGLLVLDNAELVHFIAVGSSGALVKDSPARFCGVVTGIYNYSNSGGGTGHAVNVVGMFDLADNRKAK